VVIGKKNIEIVGVQLLIVTPDPFCGDGKINQANELCEGTQFQFPVTCADKPGFIGEASGITGQVKCTNCQLDFSGCQLRDTCTNKDWGVDMSISGDEKNRCAGDTLLEFYCGNDGSPYPKSTNCPYGCSGTGATAKCKECESSSHCSGNLVCDDNGKCVLPEKECTSNRDDGSCTRGVGECRNSGRLITPCNNGVWGTQYCTVTAGSPSAEICDGKDNDCDGEIDEGCVQSGCEPGTTENCGSTTNIGECNIGTKTCKSDRTWGSCQGAVGPGSEVCDNKDNDCDGSVDEGLTQIVSCSINHGTGEKTQTCSAGSWIGGTCKVIDCDQGYHKNSDGTACVEDSPVCTPNCAGKECGSDGCDGSCGTCTSGKVCNSNGKCVVTCTDTCQSLGYECGTHSICGVNKNCGTCTSGKVCSGGKCGPISQCTATFTGWKYENGECVQGTANNACENPFPYATLNACQVAHPQDPCGNGQLDEGEICDSSADPFTAIEGSCESNGFGPGTLGCKEDCSGLDFSGCSLDCYDDDEGINVTERGIVNFNGNQYKDRCSEEGYVIEQFCIHVLTKEGTTVFGKAEKPFFCPKGTECIDGACIDKSKTPWLFKQCTTQEDCSEANEVCVAGKCEETVDVADESYCEGGICFFDESFEKKGTELEYGNSRYYLTYEDSSNTGVSLKVAQSKDRQGKEVGKLETKELKKGEVNHVLGLAIKVLESDEDSAKIEILQFSCENNNECLGNFECSDSGVCVAPGEMCIVDDDCDFAEKCEAGICVENPQLKALLERLSEEQQDQVNKLRQQLTVQDVDGFCKLGIGEISECTYQGKVYTVERLAGCTFKISGEGVPGNTFNLGPAQSEELADGVLVMRDIRGCSSQYLVLRFFKEGGLGLVGGVECLNDEECGEGMVCSDEGYCITYSQEAEIDDLFCVSGCLENGRCYPVGYRKGAEYCGMSNEFLPQMDSEEGVVSSCDNNFECLSNLCLNGECVSRGFVNSISGFFRQLFSVE
jgi:hypothetical protein